MSTVNHTKWRRRTLFKNITLRGEFFFQTGTGTNLTTVAAGGSNVAGVPNAATTFGVTSSALVVPHALLLITNVATGKGTTFLVTSIAGNVLTGFSVGAPGDLDSGVAIANGSPVTVINYELYFVKVDDTKFAFVPPRRGPSPSLQGDAVTNTGRVHWHLPPTFDAGTDNFTVIDKNPSFVRQEQDMVNW